MNRVCLLIIFASFNSLFGQSSDLQTWEDYTLNYPFFSNYNLKYNGAYKSAFGNEDWKSIDNDVTVERILSSKIDISLSGLISYKKQTDSYNTLELRPVLGFRYHFTGIEHNPIRILIRFENRHLKNLEDDTWTQTNRLRIRTEWRVRINRKSFDQNKLWYGIADAEWFATLANDQEETFADRGRLRVGLGYKLNYTYRFELVYILQLSRNTIEDDFNGTVNIFNFRFKQYLKKGSQKKKVKHIQIDNL